ncbi:short-chain collagen C4-like [Saccostrea echinata]|uniref:short-chain collagen C4-like n=1 Tax=Saccostrea echinata TaxID=191078 RepID=UPI002A819A6D|nr:short-chain collagen C4-like [Saccostrea echinata]
MKLFCILLLLHTVEGDIQSGSCKDILQGYLAGQVSHQVEALKQGFKSFTTEIVKAVKKLEGQVNTDTRYRSSVYTRWGKKMCPPNAELVYSGFVGGSQGGDRGAAVDTLCLPRDPEWDIYTDGIDGDRAYVYGAEYQTYTFTGYLSSYHNHDVPCAVCLVRSRSVVKVFPARNTCYRGWTLEYQGYLMAGFYNQHAGTTYTCVDKQPDVLDGGQTSRNGHLFYPVEARCGALKCPPYVEGRELVCAVCSI